MTENSHPGFPPPSLLSQLSREISRAIKPTGALETCSIPTSLGNCLLLPTVSVFTVLYYCLLSVIEYTVDVVFSFRVCMVSLRSRNFTTICAQYSMCGCTCFCVCLLQTCVWLSFSSVPRKMTEQGRYITGYIAFLSFFLFESMSTLYFIHL